MSEDCGAAGAEENGPLEQLNINAPNGAGVKLAGTSSNVKEPLPQRSQEEEVKINLVVSQNICNDRIFCSFWWP